MLKAVLLFYLCIFLSGIYPAQAQAPQALPNKVIWAWQRAENLKGIDPNEFGVAYLACRVMLSGNDTKLHWRNQALKVPLSARLVPTIRIDTDSKAPPALNNDQIEKLLKLTKQIASNPQTKELQIDFDAKVSEREFYRELLTQVKAKLPRDIPLSITCLASWCLFDNWIKDLPVDETVPMMFSLGRERQKILLHFKTHNDFFVSGCCKSLGISIEDPEINEVMIPLSKQRKIPVRVYVFSRTAWNAQKLQAVRSLLGNK